MIKGNLSGNSIMKVGLIGLGKMGLNLGGNLIDHKHEVAALHNEFGGHAVEKK